MKVKVYYDVLGVNRGASEKEIRQSYRRLACLWHPDVNPASEQPEEESNEITEAHEVLRDPTKRAKYDQLDRGRDQWECSGRDLGSYVWSQCFASAPKGTRAP